MVIVENEADIARTALQDGFTVVIGHAAEPHVLEEAGIRDASKLVIAVPEGFEGGAIADRARSMNPDLVIMAHAHSDDEVIHLTRLGVDQVVTGEREIALRLIELLATANPARPAA